MSYLTQMIDRIDQSVIESELDTQCEVAESLYKEAMILNYLYKNSVYQEGDTTANVQQPSGNNDAKKDNKIETASDAWNATLGSKDEHIVFRIIAFLPRFIINFAKWIGNSIYKLFNNKNVKKDVKTIETSAPTEEEKQEVVNMLENGAPTPEETNPTPEETNPTPEETNPTPEETNPTPEETNPTPASQPNEKKNNNMLNNLLNNAIAGIVKYITTNNNGEEIELTPSSVITNVFTNKLLPTVAIAGSTLVSIVPDVKNAISSIGNLSNTVIMNTNEETTTDYNRLNCNKFLSMLDGVINNFGKIFTKVKSTDWQPQQNAGNTPEVDADGSIFHVFSDLWKQLKNTGEVLDQAWSKYSGEVKNTFKNAENKVKIAHANAFHREYAITCEGAGNIPQRINEDVQKMLSASMRFITKIKTTIQPFMTKVKSNQDVIHCFAVVADIVFDKLRKGKEAKINKGIQMGYAQAMSGKEMTMVDGSKKKPGLFSGLFNRNK